MLTFHFQRIPFDSTSCKFHNQRVNASITVNHVLRHCTTIHQLCMNRFGPNPSRFENKTFLDLLDNNEYSRVWFGDISRQFFTCERIVYSYSILIWKMVKLISFLLLKYQGFLEHLWTKSYSKHFPLNCNSDLETRWSFVSQSLNKLFLQFLCNSYTPSLS